jgi:hypothetical protein
VGDRDLTFQEERFLAVPVAKLHQPFGSGRVLEWWLDEVKVEGEPESVLRLLGPGGKEIVREQLTASIAARGGTGALELCLLCLPGAWMGREVPHGSHAR